MDRDEFARKVQELWPRYKTTEAELKMVAKTFERLDVRIVKDALYAFKNDHLDDYKPVWMVIRAKVFESLGGGIHRSELAIDIANQRRWYAEHPIRGHKPSADCTDWEVYELIVRARTQSLLLDVSGRQIPQTDPTYAERMQEVERRRLFLAHGYITDLEGRGEPVPDYLCQTEVREAIAALPRPEPGKWAKLVMGQQKDANARKRDQTLRRAELEANG